MSTNSRAPVRASTNGASESAYFEQQRAMLVSEIAQSMEHVLQNVNKLNRSLEGIIAVGNEFSSVEALWSQFENVMARDGDAASARAEDKEEAGEEDTRDGAQRT